MPVGFTQTAFMQDQTEQSLLAELAERAGIVADYYDIAGHLHFTSDDTRREFCMTVRWGRPCPIVSRSRRDMKSPSRWNGRSVTKRTQWCKRAKKALGFPL